MLRRYVAMDAHLHVNGIPGRDRPPDSYAQNGEKGKDRKKLFTEQTAIEEGSNAAPT